MEYINPFENKQVTEAQLNTAVVALNKKLDETIARLIRLERAVVEQQKHGQICPDTMEELESPSDEYMEPLRDESRD